MKLGLFSALDEELAGILAAMTDRLTSTSAGRTYHAGRFNGVPSVAVAARMGKVAAASASTTLIIEHKVTHLLVIGVAGAAGPRALRGDIIVGRRLVQHDLDASPLAPALEAPLTGRAVFEADPQLAAALLRSARAYLAHGLTRDFSPGLRDRYGLHGEDRPRILHADIMTGDRFIADPTELDSIADRVARQAEAVGAEVDVAAVDMESAAVAQVCAEHGIPFAALRIISDSADEDAAEDFSAFLKDVAGRYAAGIVAEFCQHPRTL
ncbi:MAG: 5'-methylthioadenosine/adenosylhomocysteine nucleosidase [Phycisphaerales bacterium]|nr:5'-methylthioadenosine/adenosylhomocysteine nucleosidase [Phycisphaerales bacterium]